MGERRYGQYCGLAKALDVVGERWTLLIVRELLEGPRRFTELRNWLPGLSSTLLSQRLRELERAGLVRHRHVPPPAAAQVYELTEQGHALGDAVDALAQWAIDLLGPPGSEPHTRPLWVLMAACVHARRRAPSSAAVGAHDVVVDGECHHVIFENGHPYAHAGRCLGSTSAVHLDGTTLYDLAVGHLDLAQAHTRGLIVTEGDQVAATRALEALCALPAAGTAVG